MSKILIDEATVKLALEALERYQVKRQDFDRFADEITALREALAEQPAQDDPCPGCRKGGVCRTLKCGRLKLPVDHPYRSEQPAQQKPVAFIDMSQWPPIRWRDGMVRADVACHDGQGLFFAPQAQPAQQEPDELRHIGEQDCLLDVDEKAWKSLVENRGGCHCHISPPCGACSNPISEEEMNEVGYTYTTPQPAQRTWVGLTDEEMDQWIEEEHYVLRWAEAKLKEKNT